MVQPNSLRVQTKNTGLSPYSSVHYRATEGIRTLDLSITNRLLYQLSYGGVFSAGDYKGFHLNPQVFSIAQRLFIMDNTISAHSARCFSTPSIPILYFLFLLPTP